MPRLPKENLYVDRCCMCHKLIMLNGDELLQSWEEKPERNHGYRYKCPGCNGKTSYTTTDRLMQYTNSDMRIDLPWDKYLGHPVIIDG